MAQAEDVVLCGGGLCIDGWGLPIASGVRQLARKWQPLNHGTPNVNTYIHFMLVAVPYAFNRSTLLVWVLSLSDLLTGCVLCIFNT